MTVPQLDVVIRIAAVSLLAILGALLLRERESRRLGLLFAPLALCLSGFIAGNTPDPSLRLHGALEWTMRLASGYAAPFLWWFCLASFDPEFELRGAVLTVGAVWLVIASIDRGLFGSWGADKGLSWGLIAIGLAMLAWLAWWLIRDREGDLVEGRRGARIVVPALLAGQLLLSFAKDLLLGLDWRPQAFTITQNATLLVAITWLLALLLRADTAPLRTAPRRNGPPAAAGIAETKLGERLRVLMDIERAYLDPQLTFATFVTRMGAPERAVRLLINHSLGYAHFRSFLNAYRTAEARHLLTDPERSDEKLIAIAMDSGFASLASFNRVFRASEGCAPSEYRDLHRCGKTPSEERSAGI